MAALEARDLIAAGVATIPLTCLPARHGTGAVPAAHGPAAPFGLAATAAKRHANMCDRTEPILSRDRVML